MVVLVAILALPLAAQTQSFQTWPEVDTYLTLNSDMRVSFFAAATRENRQGTSAEVGPNIDFYFKPLVKPKKITLFELDPSKSRLLMLRTGYRVSTNRAGWIIKPPPQKLGSNLGPFAAENRRTRGKTTQSQPKRDNKLANRFLVRDQGVGGSNPLSPTNYFNNFCAFLVFPSHHCRRFCRRSCFLDIRI